MSVPIEAPVTPRIESPAPKSPIPGYLTTAEIAARSGMWQDHISHLIQSGRLPAVRVGNLWLVKVEDWETYEKTKSARGRPRGPGKVHRTLAVPGAEQGRRTKRAKKTRRA